MDPDGHELSFAWRLVEKPEASTVGLDHEGRLFTLRPDTPGTFELELEVSDGYESVTVFLDFVDITAYSSYALSHSVIDAEFDPNGERIVAVSEELLTAIDIDGTESTVAIPVTARAVSVTPDGKQAAVAHDGSVTHVDLETMSVLATHDVFVSVGDVVADGKGFAHAIPASGGWERITTLELSTGVTRASTGFSIYAGTRARLHPSGTKMYGANNFLSPGDVERYSIGDGRASVDYDSPYHGDYPFCGDLWFDPRGTSLLSRCGTVVRTTDDRGSDLSFVLRVGDSNDEIFHASSSPFDDRWFVTYRSDSYNSGDDYVQTYDIEGGAPVERFDLPILDIFEERRWAANFVFASPTSSAHYVIAVDNRADPVSYALLVRPDPQFSSTNRAPVAVAPRFTSARNLEIATLDAGGSYDPEGAPLAYRWSLVGHPDPDNVMTQGSNARELTFVPTTSDTYEFQLRVNDGARSSALARATVNVFEPGADIVHRLRDIIVDVEFSASLNALVYISALDGALRILDIADLSESRVSLPEGPRTVGLSPDGTLAATGHLGSVTLVDLVAAQVLDTQSYAADWGDVVLDHDGRAHVLPDTDQWVSMYSIDFQTDQVAETHGSRAGTQIRMHPTENWIYGADRGLSPSDFDKYDTSTFPPTFVSDSPYHGDYPISGNIWISEDGERLVVAGGSAFRAHADPNRDMTFVRTFRDNYNVVWADHSAESSQWAIVANNYGGSGRQLRALIRFSDDTFDALSQRSLPGIPTSRGTVPTNASHVFHSEDGSSVILVLQGEGLLYRDAIHIAAQ